MFPKRIWITSLSPMRIWISNFAFQKDQKSTVSPRGFQKVFYFPQWIWRLSTSKIWKTSLFSFHFHQNRLASLSNLSTTSRKHKRGRGFTSIAKYHQYDQLIIWNSQTRESWSPSEVVMPICWTKWTKWNSI